MRLQQSFERCKRIRLAKRLVLAPARDAREAQRDARLVPRRTRDALERDLEHVMRLDGAHGAELLYRVRANPAVHLDELLVGQTGVSLRDGNELALVPGAERVIGVQVRAAAVPGLRVNQHRVDGEARDFPFPPRAALAAGKI